jgi:hypothetical protein
MRQIALLLLFSISLVSCNDYFGEKTNLDFIEPPEFDARQAAYVPIQPALTGLNRPVDVFAGFDELIYVVDEATEEIISFDQSGRELGRTEVPGVIEVCQDRKLDLLAIGTHDTIISDSLYTLPCIYRIQLAGQGGYGLQYSSIVNKVIHPFYYKSVFSASDAINVHLTGINTSDVNEYYVTRTGPKNNNEASILPPDNSVLRFDNEDNYVTPIIVTTSQGLFRNYFKSPSCISTFVQPPQIEAQGDRDFIVALSDPSEPIKFRYITYQQSANGISYTPAALQQDTSKAFSFITDPNKFVDPTDITTTGDGSNFIFVVDAGTDSLYQFTTEGYEGVRPPPGSNQTKYINTSFGGEGIGPTQFNNPQGVAYADEILYVADTDNGRISRFRLTLDFD